MSRRQLLERFLSRYDLTPDDLHSEIEETLGTPFAVVAGGSVLQGFGNDRSDVDLCVIVDRDKLTRFPMLSYQNTARIDVTYYGAAEVWQWADALRDEPWPPAGPVTEKRWRRQRSRLQAIARFASGLVLSARDAERERLAALDSGWLRQRAAEWWRVEAVRQRLAACWLTDHRPRLAAQRWCDAVLAALEARAAVGGQPYAKSKWLPEKLKAIGDPEGLAMLREALRLPLRDAGIHGYRERCAEAYDGLATDWPELPLRAELHYAKGTAVTPALRQTVVTRWAMRGVPLGDADLREVKLPDPGDDMAVWHGAADDPLPPAVAALFREDMLWLSLSSTR